MPKRGFDSVASSAGQWRDIVPGDPEVIGSYANGLYANTTSAKEAFPHAIHYEYDVNGQRPDAAVLDIERYDAVPAQAPAWSHAHNASKGKHVLPHPGLYCSASLSSTVISTMLDHGWKRNEFLIVSAHYGQGEHVCGPGTCHYPQADASQWDDHGAKGENTDRLIYQDHFFAGKPPDPDARYDLFDNRRRSIIGRRTEQDVVREYDRWRGTQTRTKHPHRARLALLRVQLWALRRRLLSVLKRQTGKISSTQSWRARELRDRAQGKRLV